MHQMLRKLFLPLTIIALALTVFAALTNKTVLKTSVQKNKPKHSDDMTMPIVDYDEADKSKDIFNASQRRMRAIRNARYDNRVWVHHDFQSPQTLSTTHWWRGLSALPVEQSDVIVIGKIRETQAYLSNDKSGVYTEFNILVDQILKLSKKISLSVGDSLIGERSGGAVRYPSGQVTKYFFSGQGFPRPEQTYVLFLKSNNEGQDYHILTGYQLRRGKVMPLDQIDFFAQYEGREQHPFLDEVLRTIKEAEKKSNSGDGENE